MAYLVIPVILSDPGLFHPPPALCRHALVTVELEHVKESLVDRGSERTYKTQTAEPPFRTLESLSLQEPHLRRRNISPCDDSEKRNKGS